MTLPDLSTITLTRLDGANDIHYETNSALEIYDGINRYLDEIHHVNHTPIATNPNAGSANHSRSSSISTMNGYHIPTPTSPTTLLRRVSQSSSSSSSFSSANDEIAIEKRIPSSITLSTNRLKELGIWENENENDETNNLSQQQQDDKKQVEEALGFLLLDGNRDIMIGCSIDTIQFIVSYRDSAI